MIKRASFEEDSYHSFNEVLIEVMEFINVHKIISINEQFLPVGGYTLWTIYYEVED